MIFIFMKGITPVIAIVLLLMVTIAIVGFSFTFLSSMFAGAAETTSQQMEQQLGAMSSCMQIDSISFDKVYVRNCGSGSLADFSVYVDTENIAVTNAPVIAENAVGELTLAKGVSGDVIKVTSPSAQSELTMRHCGVNKIKPDGLAGYWKLDGGAGDVSGNGNDGTLKNGLTCDADGKFGKACAFDGVNDYIDIPAGNILTIPNTMTISAWVYPIEDRWGYILGSGYYQNDAISLSRHNIDTWRFNYNKTPDVNLYFGSASLNQWYHLAIVIDTTLPSQNVKAYENGVLKGTASLSSFLFNKSTSMRIGDDRIDHKYWNGTIDDVAIWSKALTQDDIGKLYTAIC